MVGLLVGYLAHGVNMRTSYAAVASLSLTGLSGDRLRAGRCLRPDPAQHFPRFHARGLLFSVAGQPISSLLSSEEIAIELARAFVGGHRRNVVRLERMFVKVCGLTAVDDVAVAIAAGADAIGVVANRTSPRAIAETLAREIVAAADGAVETVLVVNDMPATDAAQLARRLGVSVLQLHGRYDEADFAAAGALFPRLWRATSL
ncbi:MAG: hypothetical protein WAW85_01170, partial [Gordonia sp. (in: high G+C Gram-positive bacteria)]